MPNIVPLDMPAAYWRDKAKHASRAGDYPEAVRLFRAALRKHDDNATRRELAATYADMHSFLAADRLYMENLARDPADVDSVYGLARSRSLAGDERAMAEILDTYLRAAPCRVKTLRDIVEFYEADPARMPYGIDDLRAALDGASGPDAPPYLAALAHCEACRTQVRAQLKDFDLCVMTGMTDILHYAGLPSLSLPLGTAADGTPRGVILYGADERRLYAAAAAVSVAISAFCVSPGSRKCTWSSITPGSRKHPCASICSSHSVAGFPSPSIISWIFSPSITTEPANRRPSFTMIA